MPAIRNKRKTHRHHPHGKSGKPGAKSHPRTHVADGGQGSSGDMNKILWKRKKTSKRAFKAKKKFKAKVEQAIESDFPLSRVIAQAGNTMTSLTGNQAYQQIEIMNIGDARSVLQQITQITPSTSDFSERYHLMDLRLDGFYSNQSNCLAIMDWYTLVPRTDNIQGPNSDFIQALSAVASGGEGSTGGQTAGTLTAALPGVNPFMLSTFCSKWLILEKRRVLLQPGETKEFHMYRHYNRTVDCARFQQGGTIYDAVKGLTKYWYIMAYGQPVHDQTTPTNVANGPIRIDFTVNRVYTARAVANPVASSKAAQVQTYLSSNYPGITTARTYQEFAPNTEVTASGAP